MKKIYFVFFLVLFLFNQAVYANVCDNLSQFTLPNGQIVIVKEVKDNPIVVIDTFIKTGAVNENNKNNGVAHFLEHLFFKGTKNHKRGEFEKKIESRGGVFNAATSRDYTHYYIKIDNKYFDEALDLHSDMLLNVAIPQSELDMERKVVLEEITRSNDNPSRLLFNNFMKIIFNGNSYSREILGEQKIISSIDRNEIMNFYNQWYIPQNMVTVIVGDVNTKNVVSKIAKKFNTKKNITTCAEKSPKQIAPNNITIKNNTIIEKKDVKTGYILLGFPTVGENNLKDAYALNLAGSLLSGGQNSILYKTLKEKENLILSASASNYELKNTGVFYLSVSFAPENFEKVLAKLKNELENFKKAKINENQLASIKNTIKRQYIYQNESISNISNSLGYAVAVGNGVNDYCNYIKNIEEISSDDILNVANKYFNQNNLAISVILPNENIKTQAVNKIKNISFKKNATAKKISEFKDIKKYKLNNGVILLLQNNPNNDVIATKIFLKGGSLLENKYGTANILANTMMKGTKLKTGKELELALDNIGTNISVDNAYEYFEVSMKTTKNDFNQAFNLLKEILEQPAFPQNDIDIAKKDSLLSIKSSKDNPQSIAFNNFYEKLHFNSPFFRTDEMLENSIPTITKMDVEELYNKVFSSENMIISIAGNFDTKDVINKFSSLISKNNFIQIDNKQIKPFFSPLKENEYVCEDKNSQGAWIIQGWQTQGLNSKDFIALKIISTYLGSGFSSRLFSNLRENMGLAYEVGASSSSSFNSGVFFMYIGTNPENINTVKKEFNNEINLLKTQYIPQKTLSDIKSMLIGRLKLATETNMPKAHINAYYEFFDKGYQFSYDYPELIQSVTAQDILEVANKYFSQPYITSIVAKKEYIKGKE